MVQNCLVLLIVTQLLKKFSACAALKVVIVLFSKSLFQTLPWARRQLNYLQDPLRSYSIYAKVNEAICSPEIT
jgi:hypothetical protein